MSTIMDKLLEVEYRDYTTDGRLVSVNQFSSRHNMIGQDLELIVGNEVDECMERYYIAKGDMNVSEQLKPLWRTNIVVRDYKTGRFQKWAHLINS